MNTELPLFVQWERSVGQILDQTRKFPKSIRFTFSNRIDNLVLDILESIVEARFTPKGQKGRALMSIDMGLTRLRVLLRLCHDRQYLDHSSYEHLSRLVDEAGRMVGGWRSEAGA